MGTGRVRLGQHPARLREVAARPRGARARADARDRAARAGPDVRGQGARRRRPPAGWRPELTEHDALRAHADIEFGIDPDDLTNPWHAAWASMIAFTVGALLPLLFVAFVPDGARILVTVLSVVCRARAHRLRQRPASATARACPPSLRNVSGGLLAMGVTYADRHARGRRSSADARRDRTPSVRHGPGRRLAAPARARRDTPATAPAAPPIASASADDGRAAHLGDRLPHGGERRVEERARRRESSKPTTETSPGTSRPAARAARIAPIAIMSEPHTIGRGAPIEQLTSVGGGTALDGEESSPRSSDAPPPRRQRRGGCPARRRSPSCLRADGTKRAGPMARPMRAVAELRRGAPPRCAIAARSSVETNGRSRRPRRTR